MPRETRLCEFAPDHALIGSFIRDRNWGKANEVLQASKEQVSVDFLLDRVNRVSCDASCPPHFARLMLSKLQDTPWWDCYYTLQGQPAWEFSRALLCNSLYKASSVTCKEFAKVFLGPEERHLEWVQVEIVRLWRKFLTSEGSPAELNPKRRTELLQVSSLQDLEQYPELCDIWAKTELLLKGVLRKELDDPSEGPWLVTHTLAEVDCPSILIWLALKIYPEQTWTHDHLGRLPLHYAAQHIPTKPLKLTYTGELSSANEFPSTLLLRAFPEAASFADSSGKRPLNHALDLFGITDLDHGSKERIIQWLVNPLIAAVPETLVKRECVTRLYPYQQAAVKDAPLDVVYRLLVGNPAVVQYRARSWLEKANESLLADKDRLKERVARLQEELLRYKSESPTTLKRKTDESPERDTPLSKRLCSSP